MKNLFVNAARSELEKLREEDFEKKVILEFFLTFATGSKKAKPWGKIESHLQKHGINMEKEAFQQGILKQTREGDIFIASTNKGYFLIQNKGDANVAKEWYEKRIQTESGRLENLDKLIKKAGWA